MNLGQGYIFTGICDSVHRGRHAWLGGMHVRGVWQGVHAWPGACMAGACMAGGMHGWGRGGHAWGGVCNTHAPHADTTATAHGQ